MIFDVEKLNESRKEIIEWCVQATEEFFYTAQKIGTKPHTRNSKYSYSSLTKSRKGFFAQTVEFYVIMYSSKFDNLFLSEDFAAAIRLDSKEIFFDGHISNEKEVGEVIAECCSYKKEVAKSLFESALYGEPWDELYAIEQAKKSNNSNISIIGDRNIISKGNVTKF